MEKGNKNMKREISSTNSGSNSPHKVHRKVVKNIQELPSDWRLLSNTTDEKSPYFLIESVRKEAAILEIPRADEDGGSYFHIIASTSALIQQQQTLLKELVKNSTVIVSPVEGDEKKIIEEIYKTAREGVKAEDRDYSKETGVIKQVNDLFNKAVVAKASDIHLEVRKGFTRIRARVNGRITDFYSTYFAESTGFELGRVIYQVMSAVSNATFNPRIQQDALVVGIFGNDKRKYKLRVRVATNPVEPAGFDMTMRLLIIQDSKKPLSFEELGYNKKLTLSIREAMAQPVGLTIIAGTTGSGKSTTLQNALLNKINERNGEIKVITVEDPPEYFIPGASQVPVIRDEKGNAEVGFSKAIKAAMRSDPDVIMVGEIRDNQSAQLTVQAVQSGHQVLSTIHAQSALGILNRLENLAVGRDILGSPDFIAGLIYQKLLPVLCPHCSIPLNDGNIPNVYSLEKIIEDQKILTNAEIHSYVHENKQKINLVRFLQDKKVIKSHQAEEVLEEYYRKNSEEDKEHFLKRLNEYYGNINKLDIRFQGQGCSHCNDGIKNRTVVAEVVRPDIYMLELIIQKRDSELMTYWRKNLSGRFAAEDAYDKIKTGTVSPIDVEHELGLIGSRTI